MNKEFEKLTHELENKNRLLQSQKEDLEKQAKKVKLQNKKLLKQKKNLEEASIHKSKFLSNMSHELRTPLNSIISLSRLLKRQCKEKLNDDEVEFLEIITRNGDILLTLINDILDLSKIEEGKIELNPREINLSYLLSTIAENLEQVVEDKGIVINFNLPDDFPKIVSDESRLYRIFQNIISNAVKFTEEGSISISGEFDTEKITVTVQDSGIGIEEKNLSLIFEEFKQIDTAHSSKFEGTGLGLAIASKSARMISGEIDVKSKIGEGTSFTISLPILCKIKPADEQESKINKNLHEGSLSLSNHIEKDILNTENEIDEKKKVLIIEDDPDNIISLKAVLDMRYDLSVAESGEKGLELIKNKIPHLLLLDIDLPGISGIDVVKDIKDNQYSFPVIAFTALSMRGDREKILKAGCDDYISKPYIIEELLDKIDKWLRIDDE